VRDGALHAATFADHAPYLSRASRGTAAGEPWPTDFTPELSRGFRALGAWFAMKTFGIDAYGALIEQQCALAHAFGERVAASAQLELMAPVTLNIVCFRFVPPRTDAVIPDELEERRRDAFNNRLVVALQERGLAVPSTTRIGGKLAIRLNVMNHRTTQADLDAVYGAVLAVGAEFLEAPTA
jgi:glutamate/tyrosine decarboxylase-like PLP-dependent enzyme